MRVASHSVEVDKQGMGGTTRGRLRSVAWLAVWARSCQCGGLLMAHDQLSDQLLQSSQFKLLCPAPVLREEVVVGLRLRAVVGTDCDVRT